MEEDIKILEYYNKIEPKESLDEQYKLIICQIYSVMNNFEDGLCEEMQEKVAEIKQFIENLIKGYRELEKDLHEMTISNNHKKENWIHKNCLNDYIPKSKIKEKIEELRKRNDKEPKGTMRDYLDNEVIRILQELMEDK